MPIYKGNQKIKDLFLGNTTIKKAYLGSTWVYSNFVPETIRFDYTGSLQAWTVPEDVVKVHVQIAGVKGVTGTSTLKGVGGNGGIVECDLATTPGDTLYIWVGNYVSAGVVQNASYNASDIRTNNDGVTNTTSLQSRLVVAGAGGNGATTYNANYAGNGGDGGGETADQGSTGDSGRGGTQTAGGVGGSGSQGTGGTGGFGTGGNGSAYSNSLTGGAGGAGWYGGGGGGRKSHNSPYNCGGGGGGSSYAHPTLCTNVVHTKGGNSGAGYVILTTSNK